jgi:Peptidase S46
MKLLSLRQWLLIPALVVSLFAQAQINPDTVKHGQYDMGKMWTFDIPPTQFFTATYGFTADEAWFEKARLGAIRFASWCSSSFVSANGLVMTNHHCSRESALTVQKTGEDFMENGFYAAKAADERKIADLYVDQLEKILDITARVQAAMEKGANDDEQAKLGKKEQDAIIAEYKEKDGWKGLEIQVVRFYSGGRYSLYGFKRYSDVRLVFIPELQMGYYGGDYDNFTYPRYNLDCTFFRVYDEKGKPLQTQNYFKFSTNGAQEGEAVFVVGNPGRTNRLNTTADLAYRRDVQLPATLGMMKGRSAALKQYNLTAKSDSILNEIFGLENSIKAIGGIHEGTQSEYLMARKASFEREFKAKVAASPKTAYAATTWDDIAALDDKLRTLYPTFFALANTNSDVAGSRYGWASSLVQAATAKDAAQAGKIKEAVSHGPGDYIAIMDEALLTMHLQSALTGLGANDEYVKMALNGQTPAVAAKRLLGATQIGNEAYRTKLMAMSAEDLAKETDPFIMMALNAVPRAEVSLAEFRKAQTTLQGHRAKLGRALYDVYGAAIPPDATFSLRINDGVVAGYEYNGTLAPPFTTFYGLYDRQQSFEQSKTRDWRLPARWTAKAPSAELLNTRFNFVTTNDIIGGNSGSPIINKNHEIVGLVFDGNMESLPGEFIYNAADNRTVAVHSSGILASIKHIYKAKRLHKELSTGRM